MSGGLIPAFLDLHHISISKTSFRNVYFKIMGLLFQNFRVALRPESYVILYIWVQRVVLAYATTASRFFAQGDCGGEIHF